MFESGSFRFKLQKSKMKFTVLKFPTVLLPLFIPTQVFGFYPFTLPDHMMVGRVRETLFHVPRLSCINQCHMSKHCLLYNFEPSRDDGIGLCELNRCGVEDDRERTKSLIYTRGVFYQQIRPSQAFAKVSYVS